MAKAKIQTNSGFIPSLIELEKYVRFFFFGVLFAFTWFTATKIAKLKETAVDETSLYPLINEWATYREMVLHLIMVEVLFAVILGIWLITKKQFAQGFTILLSQFLLWIITVFSYGLSDMLANYM